MHHRKRARRRVVAKQSGLARRARGPLTLRATRVAFEVLGIAAKESAGRSGRRIRATGQQRARPRRTLGRAKPLTARRLPRPPRWKGPRCPTTGRTGWKALEGPRKRSRQGSPTATAPLRPAPVPRRPGTKQALLIDMLQCPGGTTIDERNVATGWQATITVACHGRLRRITSPDA